MINKPVDNIRADDLEALATREVKERRTLDYKRDLKFASRDDRKEFLADILSFANTSGGDIIFGMDEARDPTSGEKLGHPEAPVGTALWAADDEVKRAMEQCVRDSSDPKLPSIEITIVDGGFPNGRAVVARVHKSPAAPHVSLLDQRFYSRATTGKYQMDVRQIRTAFVEAAAMEEAARELRHQRTRLIDARRAVQEDEASAAKELLPVRLIAKLADAILVVHVVASSFVDRAKRIDVAALDWKAHLQDPGKNMHLESRFNMDGLVAWTAANFGNDGASKKSLAYWQVFRAGAVEYVDTWHANRRRDRGLLVADAIETEVLEAVQASTALLSSGGADYPYFVFASLLNVRGRKLTRAEGEADRFAESIDRDNLTLPDASIETAATDHAMALRATFDTLWQAGGVARSPSYAVDGTRR